MYKCQTRVDGSLLLCVTMLNEASFLLLLQLAIHAKPAAHTNRKCTNAFKKQFKNITQSQLHTPTENAKCF